jgi:hypothetical protein
MCECGAAAFYMSKRTIWEWIAWKIGYYRLADMSCLVTARNIPLGHAAEGSLGE